MPAVNIIENYLQGKTNVEQQKQIIHDLWSIPFDDVARKHHLPETVQQAFVTQVNAISYELEIELYPDYPQLKALNCEKILVTTGFPKLQNAKIAALGIREDYSAVYIDDPFADERKHKSGIFQEIIHQKNSTPAHFVVIGDNPASEIKAGKTLGMHTVQRRKPGTPLSDHADFAIDTFAELGKILADLESQGI